MSRWRDTKKGKITNQQTTISSSTQDLNAPIAQRLKAFIVDMFLIMMPIMYITTYLIMDGKDDFQSSEMARWITSFVYGAIIVLFWKIKGQTPGLKAYNLVVVDQNTKNKLTFTKSIIRYIIFIISAMSIIGWFVPFFRKDKATLQDMVANSIVVSQDSKE
ncbi:RDD family protein [Arcobacter sp. FWKO B]|uniref:RDD family protein n=1 Tax=Arcobacter sp. FWKO B TaxID=2593672 RepID=UPI0018A55B31|nr:RDD family protein [Arcobacter sp. FWKO B]QOG12291.1 RDD family protein [Arcobacter sp. FWKO B]